MKKPKIRLDELVMIKGFAETKSIAPHTLSFTSLVTIYIQLQPVHFFQIRSKCPIR